MGKVATWRLRFHDKVMGLCFKNGVKRQDRVNARVRYIEGDMDTAEREQWEKNFDNTPEPLTENDRATFLSQLSDVAISSDAFFPFRDSIDHASKLGVKFVAQPGDLSQTMRLLALATHTIWQWHSQDFGF